MVLLVSRIKPTGKVHRLWRNYWERGRPGWPQSGEQRWLSPPPQPSPALLAGSPSPPARSEQAASPRGMAAGTVTPAPRGCLSLRSIPGLKWMNIFCQTLPCKSKASQIWSTTSHQILPVQGVTCRAVQAGSLGYARERGLSPIKLCHYQIKLIKHNCTKSTILSPEILLV